MNFVFIGFPWLLVLLHLALLIYVCWVKRSEPAEATFWLLVVALIPAGGIVLYLFFGITRVDRVDRRIRRLRGSDWSGCDDESELDWPERVRGMLRDFRPSSEVACLLHNRTLDRIFPTSLPVGGNRLELLRDGSSVYPRMLEDIRSARSTIRLQSFILMSDEVGMLILRALEEKAAEGVDVKILFDSLGSFKSYFSRFFRQCLFSRKCGFEIQEFSKLNLLAPWRFQLRNHRKLLIVDGRIAYSGGINISVENTRPATLPPSRYIHDLHCRITGPVVALFTSSFFRDWSYTTGKNLSEVVSPDDYPSPEPCGNDVVRVLAGGPGDTYQGTRQFFFATVALARRSLTIITPYLVPGSAFIDALCLAAARGVEVKIIVPQHNNHFYVDMAARNFYPVLLRRGVRIFEKTGIFSHTKALLVDREWGIMGSSNCDSRSFRLNFELDFCFEGGDFVGAMEEQIEVELNQSVELSLRDVGKYPFYQRFISGCCALLSPIL